ncbi:MAG TPA: cytochrome c oxidase assembly protein, partial [Mycobacterium sp.]|nr:cytochrome c oxidase assembly protein [Mycobacterium sp.]
MGVAVGVYGGGAGARRFLAAGLPNPGELTSTGEFVGYYAATLAGALCVGALIYILATAVPDEDGRIDPSAYRLHLWVERAAVGWFLLSSAMVFLDASSAAGAPVAQLITGGALGDALGASESARGWCAAAVGAAVLAVGIRFTLRWVGHCLLLIPALTGLVAVPVTGNPGEGPDHDLATSAVIVFTVAVAVLVGVKLAASANSALPERLHRRIQLLCVAAGSAAVIYGALLVSLMVRGTPVFGTGYGRIAAAAGAGLVIIWIIDVVAVVSSRTTPPAVTV